MIDVIGNLWTYPAEVHAITTNGVVKSNGACVMGRGCAKEARDHFYNLDVELGNLIREHGNRCFRIIRRDSLTAPITILTFPVKNRFDQPADLDLIATSCEQAMAMADKFEWHTVVIPRPGSGAGGLDYFNDVRPRIEPLLDDRFRIITFS